MSYRNVGSIDKGTMPPELVAEQQRRATVADLDAEEEMEPETIELPKVNPISAETRQAIQSVPGLSIAADQLVDERARVSSATDEAGEASVLGTLVLPYVMFSRNEDGFTFITNVEWRPKLLATYRFKLVEKDIPLVGMYAGSFFPLPGSKFNILSFIITEATHD